eukprot:TRINITY_DN4079_c0_g1_i10.p1 TRINITY_DN4079_c0_g1~~TRINITY_DN4079_c0_g1_i10.p1  ORF type:complete len:377 (-),score=50.50 TRINITY_DN4079_c0_g1_i10:525-1655(-)
MNTFGRTEEAILKVLETQQSFLKELVLEQVKQLQETRQKLLEQLVLEQTKQLQHIQDLITKQINKSVEEVRTLFRLQTSDQSVQTDNFINNGQKEKQTQTENEQSEWEQRRYLKKQKEHNGDVYECQQGDEEFEKTQSQQDRKGQQDHQEEDVDSDEEIVDITSPQERELLPESEEEEVVDILGMDCSEQEKQAPDNTVVLENSQIVYQGLIQGIQKVELDVVCKEIVLIDRIRMTQYYDRLLKTLNKSKKLGEVIHLYLDVRWMKCWDGSLLVVEYKQPSQNTNGNQENRPGESLWIYSHTNKTSLYHVVLLLMDYNELKKFQDQLSQAIAKQGCQVPVQFYDYVSQFDCLVGVPFVMKKDNQEYARKFKRKRPQ